MRIWPPRTNGDNPLVRLDHIAIARNNQQFVRGCRYDLCFQAPQVFVGAPVLCQIDGRLTQLTAMLLKLAFQPLQKSESISRGTGKAYQYFIIVHAPDFPRRVLHHDLAVRHLAVAGHCGDAVARDGDNGRTSHSVHCGSLFMLASVHRAQPARIALKDQCTLSARMAPPVHIAKARVGNVQISLRGGQACVAKKQLNGAKIGAAVQQMRREGMPHRMRMRRVAQPDRPGAPFDNQADAA